MKKLTLLSLKSFALLFLLINLNSTTFAQSDNAGNTLVSNLTIGVKAGLNYGFLSEDYKTRFTDARTDVMIGIAASYYILDWIAISPEIYYMEHGGNDVPHTLMYATGSASLIGLEQLDLEIKTLEIPILATLHIPGSSGDFLFKVIAGPSFGYTLSATGYNTRILGFNDTETYSKNDFSDVIDTWEYCGTVGAGFDIKVSSFILAVEGRYRVGFSNLHTRDNSENFRTNTFMLTLGLGL
jgi:Outer membrane protein beta-barrel domain